MPLWRSMVSTSVVLPWSTWAKMAILRISLVMLVKSCSDKNSPDPIGARTNPFFSSAVLQTSILAEECPATNGPFVRMICSRRFADYLGGWHSYENFAAYFFSFGAFVYRLRGGLGGRWGGGGTCGAR